LSGRLIDPFVGGGAIQFAAPPGAAAWANDACPDLSCGRSSPATTAPRPTWRLRTAFRRPLTGRTPSPDA